MSEYPDFVPYLSSDHDPCWNVLKELGTRYVFLEDFNGIDPRWRSEYAAAKYHVDCRVFESCHCADDLLAIWMVTKHHAVTEAMSQFTLQLMQDHVPPLMWLHGSPNPLSAVGLSNETIERPVIVVDMCATQPQSEVQVNDRGVVVDLTDDVMTTTDTAEEEEEGEMEEVNKQVGSNNTASSESSCVPTKQCATTPVIAANGVITRSEIPADRLQVELEQCLELDVLYDNVFFKPHVTVHVGGVAVHLDAFHYPDANVDAPKNVHKREYVNIAENIKLFRYAMKGAMCSKLKLVSVCFYVLHNCV